jgi:hypothetical protein
MNILTVYFVYNEIKYLPSNIEFWRRQGVSVYVIDNYSNDRTWEWLIENNIPCHRFSTNDTFDLKGLQSEAMKVIHKYKPEWVIMGAADLYYYLEHDFVQTLAYLDSMGYNQVELWCWMMKSTGEEFRLPFQDTFFYGDRWRRLIMISKYHESLRYNADLIEIENSKPAYIKGMIVNYGGCKPKEEMEVKLSRRIKAWENGLNPDWGVHYLHDKAREWKFKKADLQDIRKYEEFGYVRPYHSI